MAVAETAKSSGKASGASRPHVKSKSKTPTCRKARSALSSGDNSTLKALLWLFRTYFVTFLNYKNKKIASALGTSALLFGLSALAQSPPLPANLPDPAIELRRQQEQERALRSQQEQNANVQLKTPTGKETGRIPQDETTCFKIDRLTLTSLKPDEAKAFEWLIPYASALDPKRGFFTFTRPDNFDSPIGQCLGANGINIVITRMQNALVAKGYTTSRVLAQQQDLKSGTLNLHLMLGRIKDIKYTSTSKAGVPSYPQQPDPKPSQFTALPMDGGDVLNLRDVEMALENFKRVPTANADIQIEPSKSPSAGISESDLIITQQQKSPYRFSVGLNDSGSKATGQYQGSATISLDQLWWSNDLFYVTLNGAALNGTFGGMNSTLPGGTQGYILHYAIPKGYWLLESTVSRNAYSQTVLGTTTNYVYSGTSNNAEVKASYLFYRDASVKSTASLKAWQRRSNNYINDAEVDVQRTVVGGFDAGLNYRQVWGQKSLDSTWTYRQGTNAFGTLPNPAELFNQGSSRDRTLNTDTILTIPFKAADKDWKYNTEWRAQWARNPQTNYLLPANQFVIGGRYTVRGYNISLAAENGFLLRNDLGITIPSTQVEAYIGYDYGQVGGASSPLLVGQFLAGAALGLRGRIGTPQQNLNFDVFVATPTSKPQLFVAAPSVTGFTMTYNF